MGVICGIVCGVNEISCVDIGVTVDVGVTVSVGCTGTAGAQAQSISATSMRQIADTCFMGLLLSMNGCVVGL